MPDGERQPPSKYKYKHKYKYKYIFNNHLPDGERHTTLQLGICCGAVIVIVVLVTSLAINVVKLSFYNIFVSGVLACWWLIWMQWIWIDHGAKFSGRFPFAERGLEMTEQELLNIFRSFLWQSSCTHAQIVLLPYVATVKIIYIWYIDFILHIFNVFFENRDGLIQSPLVIERDLKQNIKTKHTLNGKVKNRQKRTCLSFSTFPYFQ